MSFRDLIKNDYTIVDDPEVLVYSSVNSTVGFPVPTDVVIQKAYRDELSGAEANPSAGVYTRHDQVWFLPVAVCETANLRPKIGDYFPDPDPTYGPTPPGPAPRLTVLEVGRNPERQYWRLIVRDLALHYQLRDVVTHLRPANKPDGSGGRAVLPFATVTAAVAARIQERDRRPEPVHGRRVVRISYSVWVGVRLDARAQDVIRDINNLDYTVIAALDPDRIDALQEIQCERIV